MLASLGEVCGHDLERDQRVLDTLARRRRER